MSGTDLLWGLLAVMLFVLAVLWLLGEIPGGAA